MEDIDFEWNLYHDNDDRNYYDINRIKELELELSNLKKEIKDVKYEYKPEIRDIYLWNGQAITLEDPSWGHVAALDIKGKYITHYHQYGDEIEEIEKNKVGKIIRPRWEKFIKTWQWNKRGVKYDEVIHS